MISSAHMAGVWESRRALDVALFDALRFLRRTRHVDRSSAAMQRPPHLQPRGCRTARHVLTMEPNDDLAVALVHRALRET